jgi:hypothetical protein
MVIESQFKPCRHWLMCMTVFYLAMAAGCATAPAPAPPAPILAEYQQVALLPFANAAALYGEDQQVRNPLTAKVFTTGRVPEEAAATMTQELWAQLRAKTNSRIIPPEQSLGEKAGLISEFEATVFSERRFVAELGRRQGADAILMGTLYRFRERVGLKYAADTPAAVTFDLLLLDAASGRVVWWRSFNEVQQPLSENLLKLGTFIKDKGRWLTAAQMGARALDAMTGELTQP